MTHGVNRFTLPNGLRVVHSSDPSTAMVAVNVLYNTGARDEDPQLTGLAHLFEHVMFGGSVNIPDYDAVLSAAGGENNAFTGSDFTVYYAIAPAQNAETLFYLESDRMLSPLLSQHTVDVQRRVVIEEFKQQCLNRPYGDTAHHLRRMVYGDAHPYAWPVIGKEFSHIERARREDLQDWFSRNYSPANAVLAITGNISFDRARQLAEKWFGSIPARPVPERLIAPVTPPAAPVYKEVFGHVPATAISIAFLTDPYGTPGFYASDAVTDILASGRASRFRTRFLALPDALFAQADASITGAEHQGMLIVNARLADESVDVRHAVDVLLSECRRLVTDAPTERELRRIRNMAKSRWSLGWLQYVARGQQLAVNEIHGETPDEALDRYLAVTASDITDTANRIFNCTAPAILIYRPQT